MGAEVEVNAATEAERIRETIGRIVERIHDCNDLLRVVLVAARIVDGQADR